MKASGTTSSAENDAPSAITAVGVPVKYRWWKVPSTPPAMNTMVANSTFDGRGLAAHQAELDEQEGDHRGREHFEEAFDPQVHHPPAPVLDHRQVRVLAPHQAGAVEQADRDGGQEQQADDRATSRPCGAAPATARGRPASARASGRRTGTSARSGRCRRIPSPGGRTRNCCARPSFCITANHWPANAPTTMISRQTNRKLTPSALELRLVPGDRRRDVQAGAEPGGGDPQHRQLRVPGARQRVRQDFGQREAVEHPGLRPGSAR